MADRAAGSGLTRTPAGSTNDHRRPGRLPGRSFWNANGAGGAGMASAGRRAVTIMGARNCPPELSPCAKKRIFLKKSDIARSKANPFCRWNMSRNCRIRRELSNMLSAGSIPAPRILSPQNCFGLPGSFEAPGARKWTGWPLRTFKPSNGRNQKYRPGIPNLHFCLRLFGCSNVRRFAFSGLPLPTPYGLYSYGPAVQRMGFLSLRSSVGRICPLPSNWAPMRGLANSIAGEPLAGRKS